MSYQQHYVNASSSGSETASTAGSAGSQDIDWTAANAYTMAYNKNRKVKGAKYSETAPATANPTTSDVAPGDFPAPKDEAGRGVGGINPASYEAAPGEYHPEANRTDKSLQWTAANAYTKLANEEAGRKGFAKEDKTHYYGEPSVNSKQGLKTLEAMKQAGYLDEVLGGYVSDFPQPELNRGGLAGAVYGAQIGAAPGDFGDSDNSGKKKAPIAWADANRYVYAQNKDAGRPNKLPAYVMRAWQADGAVAAA